MDANQEDTLWRIFENVNNWLQYAEQKNTYTIGFIGIETTLLQLVDLNIDWFLMIAYILFVLCFFVCLGSFFPKTFIANGLGFILNYLKKPEKDDNLLFFGHIAKYFDKHSKLYCEKINNYMSCKIENDKYAEDLCMQILVNSDIAYTKFIMFKISFWLLFFGQIFLIISVLKG